ncbi:hypothetical protein [Kitasatospora purpeofusca]|uniref:hypothetical protein n=1 Tax=Kitasatospora purpeofusca TaxID=67352 RepID=UPI0038630900|nr:hypothetical protein OIP63_37955 [Kitasatospora purpeofusca]
MRGTGHPIVDGTTVPADRIVRGDCTVMSAAAVGTTIAVVSIADLQSRAVRVRGEIADPLAGGGSCEAAGAVCARCGTIWWTRFAPASVGSAAGGVSVLRSGAAAVCARVAAADQEGADDDADGTSGEGEGGCGTCSGVVRRATETAPAARRAVRVRVRMSVPVSPRQRAVRIPSRRVTSVATVSRAGPR